MFKRKQRVKYGLTFAEEFQHFFERFRCKLFEHKFTERWGGARCWRCGIILSFEDAQILEDELDGHDDDGA